MPWNYFVQPILQNGGFNTVNTLVLGLILAVSIFLVYRLIRFLKVPIDAKFFIAIAPFIFWAASTRVLRDLFYSQIVQNLSQYPGFLTDLSVNINTIASTAQSHIMGIIPIQPIAQVQAFIISWFVTPSTGSYVFTFLLALGVFLLCLLIQKYTKIPYWKPMLVIGLAFCAWNLLLLPVVTLYPAALILGMTLAWTGLFFLITHISRRYNLKSIKQVFTPVNSFILSAHMLDASATFVSLSLFGYSEQHVLPNMLIPFLGPAAMFLLKLVVLLPVLYIIDKETQPGNFRNFLKIAIIILGLAPGTRDLLRLIPMV